jgi:hypothetical protein
MKSTRRTIGANPLNTLILDVREREAAGPVDERARPAKIAKERLTVHVPVNLIDRVENAVYWTPGVTLARLAEEALEAKMDELEAKRGEPYPPREQELRGGRPIQ